MTVLSPGAQALKRAARELTQAAGGIETGSRFTRVRQSRLADYGNVNVADAFMPIDVAADLEAVTQGLPGAPHVTRALASAAGFALVPLPGATSDGRDWLDHIARVAKESADVFAKIAAAAARPGGLTLRDVSELQLPRECDELIAAAVDIKAAVLAIASG